MATDVLVLNADFQPLHRVSLRHAVRMLVRQVAEIEEGHLDRLIGVFPMPTVVRLLKRIVTEKWRRGAGPGWSRQGVLKRDRHRCGYCDRAATTIDHVLPRSRGGANAWDNTVASCYRCNQRKANRTPREAGMKLRVQPYAPSWVDALLT